MFSSRRFTTKKHIKKLFSGILSKWTSSNGYCNLCFKMLEKQKWNSFSLYLLVEILQLVHEICADDAFNHSSKYNSISVYILWNAVLYGLKVYKHVELICYCHIEFVFLMENLVKIWHFFRTFFQKCYYENLFTLNL